ncbi:MAG: alpha-L-rhamnosidase [Kiritimatiellae bacterium]|nr:alpha-L-rhamnosidase [Kiritimatiellia bacterium]
MTFPLTQRHRGVEKTATRVLRSGFSVLAAFRSPFLLFSLSVSACYALTPRDLAVDLAVKPGLVAVANECPHFSWRFDAGRPGDKQTAYQIQVATSTASFRRGKPDLWDSGRVASPESLSVPYAGAPLPAERSICWRVRVWDKGGAEGPWSETLSFKTADRLGPYEPLRYKSALRHVAPVRVFTNTLGNAVVDFGKDAWGWIELLPPMSMTIGGDFSLHVGERIGDGGVVDRKPGGTVRYVKVNGALTTPGIYRVPFPADKRNTNNGKDGPAIRLPNEFGVVMPFRYVEVADCPYRVTRNTIRMIAVNYPMDMKASAFVSSDPALDKVYNLCKYTVWATSFAGVYIDGDRERIPYEADAYINQLSHYAVEGDYTLARYSHEYLMKHPTWPTEWRQHSIFMAWADWMWTGDRQSLARCYESLKNDKLLSSFVREKDGLLETKGPQELGNRSTPRDIVDWPPVERDGFEFRTVNTVVNAFYCRNLRQMAEIAEALGKREDALNFQVKADQAAKAFHAAFYDRERGCYLDGEGASHASLHANAVALAFGLVPAADIDRVADFLESRGMACSVYMAQYLLEGLFNAGRDEAAINLITRTDKRGWLHMIDLGSTMTLEAWDAQYKPNLDWNHAWGTAPLNVIARYILGVRPLAAGFGKVLIRPQTGTLEGVEGIVPTVRGGIRVGVRHAPRGGYRLLVSLPANTEAVVELPALKGRVTLDGSAVAAKVENGRFVLTGVPSGKHEIRIEK